MIASLRSMECRSHRDPRWRLLATLLALSMSSLATFADPLPAHVGFTLRSPGDPCGITWILPNDTQPDFFHFNQSPGYNQVVTGSNCVPGASFVYGNIIFPDSGGIAFNDFATDYLGALLFTLTANGVSFNLGVFALSYDVDPPGFVRALIDIHAAPEPATLLLVLGGLAAIWLWRRPAERGEVEVPRWNIRRRSGARGRGRTGMAERTAEEF